MFECAYAQLVLPWYSVPEPCEQQPLHQVLSREVDIIIDRVIEKAKDFDVCQAVVGSIRILTQHLHNAKQSDRQDDILLFMLLQLLFGLSTVCLNSINSSIFLYRLWIIYLNFTRSYLQWQPYGHCLLKKCFSNYKPPLNLWFRANSQKNKQINKSLYKAMISYLN